MLLRQRTNLKKTLFLKNFIVFLIPSFLLVSVLFYFLNSEMSHRALQNYQRQFDRMCITLNSNFETIQNLSSQLSNSSWMQQMFLQKYDVFQSREQDIYKLNTYNNNLNSYKTSNDFISQIAVYFLNGNYILTTKGMFLNNKNLYPLKPTSISKDMWEYFLSQTNGRRIIPTTEVDVIGSTDEGVLFMQSIPYIGESPRAIVLVFVQKRLIESTIQESIGIEPGMQLQIANISGSLIYDTESLESIKKKNDTVTLHERISKIVENQANDTQYIQSGDDYIFVNASYTGGMSYYLKIPKMNVMSSSLSPYAFSLYITLLIIFIIILVAGILMSRYISKVEYKPVAEIIQKIEDIEKTSLKLFQTTESCVGMNEYQKISSALHNVTTISEDLLKRLEDNKYKVQKMMLLQFLTNDTYVNEEQLIDIFPSSSFCCFSFQAKDMIEVNTLQELFCPLVTEKELIFTTLEYNNSFIMFVHGITEEVFETYIRRLQLVLQSTAEIKMTVGCSQIEVNPKKVKRAFFQAIKAMEYNFIKEQERVIQYSQICSMENKQYYVYNIDIETELIDSLRAGAEKKAISIVQESIRQNLEDHRVSINAIKQLLAHFITLAYNIANEVKIYEEIKAKLAYENIKETVSEELNYIFKIYEVICETICLKQASSQDYLKHTFIEYIDKNFDNPNLTLKKIASDFGYSAPYFSMLFKSTMKQGLAKYICYRRMQIAKELLVTSNLNIIEISKEVGFSSDITFRRMFKRLEKISASEYRAYYNVNKLVK